MIRSIAFNVAFYVTTALFLIFCSPLLLAPRRWAVAGLRAHAHTTLWLMRWIVGTEMEVRGREHLPEGAYLVAAKHQSAWDTVALILLFPDPALVMKAELLKIPVYGWFCAKFGMIPIQRETGPSALRQMLKAARGRAEDGRQILVFPEGTRRLPGAEPDYKPGILLLYDALKLPCVPVALNSGHFWPRNSMQRRPGKIVVEIQPALPAGLPRKEFRSQLIDAIEEPTVQLLGEATTVEPRR
ncbi:MAG: 1-acyl-sn-glycerol-3-phosphate acyltransferase [Hyphomicrobiaceae bacterium]|jgi:1-acyl-sn-glycerol-3-phosphate acyltransferase